MRNLCTSGTGVLRMRRGFIASLYLHIFRWRKKNARFTTSPRESMPADADEECIYIDCKVSSLT
jgi:hypothetical protein